MINIIRKRIVLKLTTIIIFSVSIAVSIFIIYSNSNYLAASRSKLDSQVDDLLLFATNANQSPLFNLDVNTVNQLNKALMKNPMIVAVNIYLTYSEKDSINHDQFYTSLSKEDYKSLFQKTVINNAAYKIPALANDIKMLQNEIRYNNESFGKIQLFYTDHFMVDDVRKAQISNIISYVILAVLLTITILVFLSFYLIRPILILADIFKAASVNNNYNVRIDKPADDEIGILQKGFNQFLNNIQNREKERDDFDSELKRTKDYLHNIIDSMSSLLITTDNDGYITQFNQAVSELPGFVGKDLTGLKVVEIFPILHDVLKMLKAENDNQHLNLYRQNLPDFSKSANISVYPLISEGTQGRVIRIDDMSELYNKEEQLRQVQKMETIGTLAGGLAHDFNNVLSGIVGTLSLLKFKFKKTATIGFEEFKGYMETMEDSAKRAADMVQQLMALSRKQELSMSPIDLNLSVKHVLKICQNTFDKCVSICYSQDCSNARIMADPTQIEQVILNICVNAYHSMTMMRKETETLGGVLDLRINRLFADKHFCSVHHEAEFINYWRLDISDNGIGMDSKTIAKIFEPFFTTKEKNKGTGLGLSMVYGIIKQHKGFVDVYSEVGIGTTFSVFLPVLLEYVDDITKPIEQTTKQGQGTILVIDDEEIMRTLVKEMLEECGYDLLFAADGEEGLTIYQQNYTDIDLILLDMIMPKKSGPETFAAIRQITPDAKVILSSGFRQDEKAEKLLDNGAITFIQKPYTITKLSEVIYQALNK